MALTDEVKEVNELNKAVAHLLDLMGEVDDPRLLASLQQALTGLRGQLRQLTERDLPASLQALRQQMTAAAGQQLADLQKEYAAGVAALASPAAAAARRQAGNQPDSAAAWERAHVQSRAIGIGGQAAAAAGAGSLSGLAGAAGAALSMAGPEGAVLGALVRQLPVALDAFKGAVLLPQTALEQFRGAVEGAAASIRPYVEAYSPATVQRFDRALQDFNASVGASVRPLMDAFAGLFNVANRVLTSLQGNLGPAFEDVARIVEDLGLAAGQALAPALQMLAGWFRGAVAQLQPYLGQVQELFQALGSAGMELLREWIEFDRAFAVTENLTHGIGRTAAALTALVDASVRVHRAFVEFGAVTTEILRKLASPTEWASLASGGLGDILQQAMDRINAPIQRPGALPQQQTVAARQAEFISLEEVSRRAVLAGMRSSGPLDRNTNALERLTDSIRQYLQSRGSTPQQAQQEMDWWQAAAQQAASALPGLSFGTALP